MLVSALKVVGQGQLQIEGFARLMAARQFTHRNRIVSVLKLADASGVTDRVIALSDHDRIERLQAAGAIKIRLQLPERSTDEFARVVQIRPAAADEIVNAAALLPRTLCPAAANAALDQLIAFNAAITNSALRRFLNAVLLDPEIGTRLLRATASHGYHHAEPGGLLIHCTELLPEAARLASAAFPNSADAVTVIQLGYLLHDLGKVLTHGPKTSRAHERHELLTLKLLTPYLRVLKGQQANLANALQKIFEHCATPARQRSIASFLGADIVVWCDQLSTARNHGSTWTARLSQPAMNDADASRGVRRHG